MLYVECTSYNEQYTMYFFLNRKGYVPGEQITFDLHITNKSGQELTKWEIRLLQVRGRKVVNRQEALKDLNLAVNQSGQSFLGGGTDERTNRQEGQRRISPHSTSTPSRIVHALATQN